MTPRGRSRTAAELALLAAVAGYARRASERAQARRARVIERTGRLAEANELLSSLHEVAQGLPAPLDLQQVLDSTATTLRSLWEGSATAVLVPDETSDRWIAVHRDRIRLPYLIPPGELPTGLARASRSRRAVIVSPPTDGGAAPDPEPGARSGIYTALYARDRLVGLLAVEHPEPGYFQPDDRQLLDAFAETAALVLDNARWFARLRMLGAEAERTRIASELHDRVGQSLAALSFELDRLSRHSADEELRPGIARLRGDVRRAMAEIRDTLYELRTDVTEAQGLDSTIESYLDQVARRSDVAVHADIGTGLRLPLLQEREMWRIAQEAVVNAERHAGAKEIVVRWHYDGPRAELEVIDDGRGFPATTVPSGGAGGLVEMRERAASIGATLDVESAPGRGTRVRCTLGAS